MAEHRSETDGDRRFYRRLAVAAFFALMAALTLQSWPRIAALLSPPAGAPREVAARGDLADIEAATIALFEATRPSVVQISTAGRVVNPWTRNAYSVPRGTGSGFLWDRRGHVVTNEHVVEGASAATVRLADGTAYRAQLVGTDPRNDLAVLRIPLASDLPPVPIGTSSDLQVGQSVFAIGNPFGLDWTLTTGVVSALGRELPIERGGAIRGLIQTDAAINPGNSGGPLLDSAGRLIGVNTAIYSPSGSNAGIGFAVPVDVVNRVVPQIIANGRYAAPSLGIETDPQVNALAARQGLRGVLVLGTEPGSGAARAGLRPARVTPDGRLEPGDVIVGVGDRQVDDLDDLTGALDAHLPGEIVSLRLLRDGRVTDAEVTLGAGG